MNKLQHGYRYQIKRPDSRRYRYAEPVQSADACTQGACWIVDAAGNVDPGYNVPVTFCITELHKPQRLEATA